MRCPLCGADNLGSTKRCALCDTPLRKYRASVSTEEQESQHIALETLDASRVSIQWHRIVIAFVLLAITLWPWLLFKDFLEKPGDVEETRSNFLAAKQRYFTDRDRWNGQKDQVLKVMSQHSRDFDPNKIPIALSAIPMEVLIAYLADDLALTTQEEKDFCIFPVSDSHETRILLSKVDRSLWPFSIYVSMDVVISNEGSRCEARCIRFRKGSQEQSPEWAWTFFSRELQALRRLESYAGGIRQFLVHRTLSETGEMEQTYLSWEYMHSSFGPAA